MLRFRDYRDKPIVYGRIEDRKKTECKSCGDLGVFILCVDEVYLVVRAYVLVGGELRREIYGCVNESLVALRGDALDNNKVY